MSMHRIERRDLLRWALAAGAVIVLAVALILVNVQLIIFGPDAQGVQILGRRWREDLVVDAMVAIEDRRAGDLVVFRWKPRTAAKHVGILVERDRFLHAYEGHAVVTSPLVAQWRRRSGRRRRSRRRTCEAGRRPRRPGSPPPAPPTSEWPPCSSH